MARPVPYHHISKTTLPNLPDFDFFSVQDEAMVELKVIGAFQAARKNPDCKHIFLAAWRRPLYMSMLQAASKNVTLAQGSGMGAGAKFVPLPCDVISTPEVFSKPVEYDSFSSLTSRSTGKHIIATLVSDKAACKDGRCALSHTTASLRDTVKKTASRSTTDVLYTPSHLPLSRDAIPGHVPVNANGQRLDYYTQRPSTADNQAYLERFGTDVKPCRWFHLAKTCHFQDDCVFDHSDISFQIHRVIQRSARRTPCYQGSHCRLIECI